MCTRGVIRSLQLGFVRILDIEEQIEDTQHMAFISCALTIDAGGSAFYAPKQSLQIEVSVGRAMDWLQINNLPCQPLIRRRTHDL